jgi:hypothetical protein
VADLHPIESQAPKSTEIPLSRVLVEEYEAQFGPLEAERRDSILKDPPAHGGNTHEARARAAFFAFLHESAGHSPSGTNGPSDGKRSALCLSGGGIRSATFNLGVLQRLARIGLLKKIDFLSTVSGGGYIGSWLSAWLYNADHDIDSVQEQLSVVTRKHKDPVNPEPGPVKMLRRYSRFLSPRAGLLSADTWTLFAIYLRNLLLTWSVFLPLLAAGVMVVKVMASGLSLLYEAARDEKGNEWTRAILAAVVFLLGSALGMALFTQTSLATRLSEVSAKGLRPVRSATFVLWWLAPVMLGCVALAGVPAVPPLEGRSAWDAAIGLIAGMAMLILFAIRLMVQRRISDREHTPATPRPRSEEPAVPESTIKRVWRWLNEPFNTFVFLVVIVTIGGPTLFLPAWSLFESGQVSFLIQHLAFGAYLGVLGIFPAMPLFETWRRRGLHLLAAFCGGATSGLVLWLGRLALIAAKPSPAAADSLDLTHELWIAQLATFGPPLAALSIATGAVVYVGFISRSIMAWDADREWWARAGALILRFAVAWMVVFGVVIFGPPALVWAYGASKEAIVGLGGLTGVATILLGASGSTPAASDSGSRERASPITSLALRLAAPIFILLFFAFLSFVLGRTIIAMAGIDPSTWHIPDAAWLSKLAPEITSTSYQAFGASLLLVVLLGVAFLVPSVFVNLTKFSLHGMYRDRLIRAFLGASAPKPDRDGFTDFDDRDNIFFGKIRVGALRVRDLATTDDRKHYPLILALCAASPTILPDATPRDKLLSILRRWVEGVGQPAPAVPHVSGVFPRLRLWVHALEASAFRRKPIKLPASGVGVIARDVVERLNDLLCTTVLDEDFLANPTAHFEPRRISPTQIVRNRRWLQKHLGGLLANLPDDARTDQRPFHIVNVALNIVAGDNNAWQDRKAASLTFSPYHAGASHLGYRDTRLYGGARGTSLGTAMTLSGAAVSPNQGYHSSPPIAFLLALFNVRLGAWLGNPGPRGERTHKLNAPRFLGSFFPLKEALGFTNDHDQFIYLSDGGHFDNLGLYEMVQRRCHSIVVVDAGADPKGELFDLGNAIRKIRIDLGIPIDLDDFDLHPKRPEPDCPAPHPGTSCGLGTIRYDVVDGPQAQRGRLLYIKPCVYWKEPADVLNYARSSKDFPHETTTDQWFSEPQFESYRQLGWHIMKTISSGGDCKSIHELIDRAQAYLDRYHADRNTRDSGESTLEAMETGGRFAKRPPG